MQETADRQLYYTTSFKPCVADLHISDGRLVPVVDHLFEPQALVKHPHYDQASLVARRELRVRRVPGNANLVSFLVATGGTTHVTSYIRRQF